MANDDTTSLLDLTAEIVSAHVAHNSVHSGDLPRLISSVHEALSGLGTPVQVAEPEPEYKAAVTLRKSLASDEHIISMIDGKPYKTLRRHLAGHGLTDKDYRARYNLPADYPMVSRAYSAARSAMARTIGLGRKAGQKIGKAASALEHAAAPAAAKVKRGAGIAAAKADKKPVARKPRARPAASEPTA